MEALKRNWIYGITFKATMTETQLNALKPYFEPIAPRIAPDMTMEEYRAIPAFNPSLIKLGANEIKNAGARGHITRILDKLENEELVRTGKAPLPGRGDNGSKSKDMGSLYHQLMLEPDSFRDNYEILTPEIKEGLLVLAKRRKSESVAPVNSRMKEWRDFKAAQGRDPNQAEQDGLNAMRREAAIQDCSWHARLTEFTEWVYEQESHGRKVVTEDEVGIAKAMADSIHTHPANAEIAHFLESQGSLKGRVEVSMFTTLEWANGGQVALKGRPDIVARTDAFLDPKSCQSAHPFDFARAVDQFGYAIQAGAYLLMSELLADTPEGKALGFPKREFGFIAQETTAPFLAKLWWLPQSWLAYGRFRFLALIREVQGAMERDDWSGAGDEFVFNNSVDKTFSGETLEPPQHLMATLEQF